MLMIMLLIIGHTFINETSGVEITQHSVNAGRESFLLLNLCAEICSIYTHPNALFMT